MKIDKEFDKLEIRVLAHCGVLPDLNKDIRNRRVAKSCLYGLMYNMGDSKIRDKIENEQ